MGRLGRVVLGFPIMIGAYICKLKPDALRGLDCSLPGRKLDVLTLEFVEPPHFDKELSQMQKQLGKVDMDKNFNLNQFILYRCAKTLVQI